MNENFNDNRLEKRYELAEEGSIVYADYSLEASTLTIRYVFAPPELRGKGSAGRLMTKIMQEAIRNHYTVRPFCGYARGWLERHSEYSDHVEF